MTGTAIFTALRPRLFSIAYRMLGIRADAEEQHHALLGRFIAAAQLGDRAAMKTMLADDVQLVADGGGKINSYLHILHGAGRVAGSF